jgi:hypothetical protein
MASLSPEQERINAEHIRHQVRDHVISDPSCPECKRVWNLPPSSFSTSRSSAYNAIHGTQLVNDAALDKMLENETEIRRIMNE